MPIEQQNSHTQPATTADTIVHLGAGRCSELDDYLSTQAERLLLVEADPQLAEALQARTTNFPQVEVINRAVAGQSGSATFYRYNLTDVSSLHRAGPGLLELFPGLKVVRELRVQAVDPATLLQPLKLQADQHNRLIIDLPGAELPVLKALQQAGQLYLFDQLQFHCGRQALYEGGEPAATILQWLQDQGFDLLTEDDSEDPERPSWDLKCNKQKLLHRELKQQLAQLTKAHDEQATLLNERYAQINRLTKERDDQAKLAADNKTQLEKANQAGAEQEKLANKRQVQIDQLTKERDDQAKLAADNKTQLEKANQAKAELEKLANERQVQIDQLTKARDEQARLVVTHQQQYIQEKQRADDNQQKLEQKQKELEKLEQQLSELNQKLPMLDDEFVKAEAQIELIKDILIREKAF